VSDDKALSVHVARQSGLLVPFEAPELTMEQAIDRGWARRPDGRLLRPKPEEYLPTELRDALAAAALAGNTTRTAWWFGRGGLA
jgi:hypothetical protein